MTSHSDQGERKEARGGLSERRRRRSWIAHLRTGFSAHTSTCMYCYIYIKSGIYLVQCTSYHASLSVCLWAGPDSKSTLAKRGVRQYNKPKLKRTQYCNRNASNMHFKEEVNVRKETLCITVGARYILAPQFQSGKYNLVQFQSGKKSLFTFYHTVGLLGQAHMSLDLVVVVVVVEVVVVVGSGSSSRSE